MGRFISVDLRERILAMILSGSSCRAAARHFGVGESTAIRLRRRYLAEGTIEPKLQGGQLGRSKLLFVAIFWTLLKPSQILL